MRVKCVLCDTIQSIEDRSSLAKRLRNRPIHTYMCDRCQERITDKTNKRIATGNFMLYRTPAKENEW
ncbi:MULTISPECIES: YlaI family protein [Fictibacillus]|uniref:YlaI family protein n=1 Tax=Fictibacillus terranigra TaxID=3058424 RepID=A0ABT8E6Q0_9BACL|nr:YlaI family protein [Fictibacillus sp. CENA-BCM004]MDN4073586.1 YlaI family protein [Fictibacillus sp. CENA-BCM004]